MVEERVDQRGDGKFSNQTSRNDVSWYSRNPTLLSAAASIPFPYRPGMQVPWISGTGEGLTGIASPAIPGIMALNWWPTVGYSQSATDPASVVGKEIFAKVREKFSGSIDADAPDFVIYIMALDSVFSYIASLKRMYRVLTAYTSENHYIPDALMQALGLTAAQTLDLKEHRMQFFQIINELVYMTRKFNLPAAFDIINRHYWLNDNVYMDDDTINSQFYVFHCLGYYQYGLTEISTGVEVGSLQMQTLTIPASGVAEYLFTFGRSLIDALASSDDAYIISGYLMRAYEGFPGFMVDELQLEDRLVPHYDPEVLMQIENSLPIIIGTKYSSSAKISNNITQDPSTNAVVCVPTLTCDKPAWYGKVQWKLENYLSIRSDAPTVADVTIATRLKMGVRDDKSTSTSFNYQIACGSEILDTIMMYVYQTDIMSGSVNLRSTWILGLNYVDPSGTGMPTVYYMTLVESFDWHPIVPYVISANTDGTYWYVAIAGDVHNLTLLTNEQLYQINRVCLYSEFNAYGQL